jgi:iron(III) transport system substrate-binding protein
MHRSLHRLTSIVIGLGLLATACGSDGGDNAAVGGDGSLDGVTITVYTGRGEDLIGPVFDLFEERTGATVDARYGGSADQALLIDTEGDRSPADVFISQSPGAVGFLDQQGRLLPLSADTLERVDEAYRGSDNNWVGITGRVRVLVYNPDLVDASELPASVLDLTDPAYAGRVGVAPGNGSFQDFVTGMRAELGDEATAVWLAGMAANNSPNYTNNGAILDAVARGEIDMGLVNHYYLAEAVEEDPGIAAVNYFFPAGDLGSLLIVTAAGVVDSSDDPAAAEALVRFLLSDEAQQLSAAGEKEYPLVAGVAVPEGLAPLDEVVAVNVDLDVLAEGLLGTADLIDASGIQQ